MYTLLPVSAYLNMTNIKGLSFHQNDNLVPVGKLHDWAGELPVACESVHLLPVPDGVPRVQPVCVFKLDGFPDRMRVHNYIQSVKKNIFAVKNMTNFGVHPVVIFLSVKLISFNPSSTQ